MPIGPGTTLPIFTAALLANGLVGSGTKQLAAGLAMGLFQYTQTGVIVTSIDVGTFGAGTGIGPSIVLLPTILLPAMTDSFIGHGIVGPFMPAQANACAYGISAALALAVVETVNPLVGVGAGKLQLIPNGTGSVIFPQAFTQSGATGSMSAKMASAIGLALDAVIASAIGIIAIVGIPSIVPGAGLGNGKIV